MRLSKQLEGLDELGIGLRDPAAGYRALVAHKSPVDFHDKPFSSLLLEMVRQRLTSSVVLITGASAPNSMWSMWSMLAGSGAIKSRGEAGETWANLPATLAHLTGLSTQVTPSKRGDDDRFHAHIGALPQPFLLEADDPLGHLLRIVASYLPGRPAEQLLVGTPKDPNFLSGMVQEGRFITVGDAANFNGVMSPQIRWEAVKAPWIPPTPGEGTPGALSVVARGGADGGVSLARDDGALSLKATPELPSARSPSVTGPDETKRWYAAGFVRLYRTLLFLASLVVGYVYVTNPAAPRPWWGEALSILACYTVVAFLANILNWADRDGSTLRIRRGVLPHLGFRWFSVDRADVVRAYVEDVVVGSKSLSVFYRVRLLTADRKDRVVSHPFGLREDAEELARFLEGTG